MDKYYFDSLTQNITEDEMKKIQLQILNAFAEFCDTHGLRYYLTGGTLLGAVRHNGFIPWDDDIDVNMPRPDYERLIKLSDGMVGSYKVLPPQENNINDALVVKLIDQATVVQESIKTLNGYEHHYTSVFIDVFPLEGLPNNKVLFYLHCLHVHYLVGMCRTAINGTSGRSIKKRIIRIPMVPIAKAFGAKYWKKRIANTVKKYDFNDSEMIGVLLSRNRFKDYLKKEKYLPYDDTLIFEGYHFHAPVCYREHLTMLYGDYMELPPLELRNSGHMLVGKRKER